MLEQRSYDLEVFAGPCSVSRENIGDIYRIADLRIQNARGEVVRAVSGTRVVGLKSRTSLSNDPNAMGIDYHAIEERIIMAPRDVRELPSVTMAASVVADTDMVVATEIMMPDVQLPEYAGRIPNGKLLLWNPAVDQLGWHILQMAVYAREYGWHIGIKNGKSLGSRLGEANDHTRQTAVELERTWAGLATYAKGLNSELILIHRGVEDPEKGDFRSALVHEVARRVKLGVSGAKLFFDPSHSLGPKLRDRIVPETIEAMRMRTGNEFLYDGILLEAGHSETDSQQHVTIDELGNLVRELSRFRTLRTPQREGNALGGYA